MLECTLLIAKSVTEYTLLLTLKRSALVWHLAIQLFSMSRISTEVIYS